MRSELEFQKIVTERDLKVWQIHDCSMCRYPCGFIFEDGDVGYDSGCDCTGGSPIQYREWSDVADHYNRQSNPDVTKNMDDFWGFAAQPPER